MEKTKSIKEILTVETPLGNVDATVKIKYPFQIQAFAASKFEHEICLRYFEEKRIVQSNLIS